MEETTIYQLLSNVEQASTGFEMANTDLKRKFILWNIQTFRTIAKYIPEARGTFGTGYPFYALDTNLNGTLPVIQEQIRYNRALVTDGEQSKLPIHEIAWKCKKCLRKHYEEMPDLKQICKPCPAMDNNLKPRKLINRLPDIDMWLVCNDGDVIQAQDTLQYLLDKYQMKTSDVDPLSAIKNVASITSFLQQNKMPQIYLPLDAHIIEYSVLKQLIEEIPEELKRAKQTQNAPFLPIHPKSLRKNWQYDDSAYNFVVDFLCSLTPFDFPRDLNQSLEQSRAAISNSYTNDNLWTFLMQSATPSTVRRLQTPELRYYFNKKMDEWRKIKSKEEPQKPLLDPHDNGPTL